MGAVHDGCGYSLTVRVHLRELLFSPHRTVESTECGNCLCGGGGWGVDAGFGIREEGVGGWGQNKWEDGSSPELAGPALVAVVWFRVGLPAFPLRRLVVNVGRRAWVAIVWILLHHLELGFDGADLSTRAGGRRKKWEEVLAVRLGGKY